jgi:hypothetical protein
MAIDFDRFVSGSYKALQMPVAVGYTVTEGERHSVLYEYHKNGAVQSVVI